MPRTVREHMKGSGSGSGNTTQEKLICHCKTNCKVHGGLPVSRTTLWRHRKEDEANGFTAEEDTSVVESYVNSEVEEYQSLSSSSDDNISSDDASYNSAKNPPTTRQEQVEQALRVMEDILEGDSSSEEGEWAQDFSDELASSITSSLTPSISEFSDINDDELPTSDDLANEELQRYID